MHFVGNMGRINPFLLLSLRVQVLESVNKSVFGLVSSAVNMTLPAFAAERRAAAPLLLGARRTLSIDISYPRGTQQQTRRTPEMELGHWVTGEWVIWVIFHVRVTG